jgi:hypothetical protein
MDREPENVTKEDGITSLERILKVSIEYLSSLPQSPNEAQCQVFRSRGFFCCMEHIHMCMSKAQLSTT